MSFAIIKHDVTKEEFKLPFNVTSLIKFPATGLDTTGIEARYNVISIGNGKLFMEGEEASRYTISFEINDDNSNVVFLYRNTNDSGIRAFLQPKTLKFKPIKSGSSYSLFAYSGTRVVGRYGYLRELEIRFDNNPIALIYNFDDAFYKANPSVKFGAVNHYEGCKCVM